MNFIPKKSADTKAMYKEHLLNGDVLKIDAGGCDQIDLIPRQFLNEWSANKNVGEGGYLVLPRHIDAFRSAIDELKNEGYVVKKLHCRFSGCCQYAAYRYYLEGEMSNQ